jgi:hypothetical protein
MRRRGGVAVLREAVAGRERIVIRHGRAADGGALAKLAELAERHVPAAPVLLAESDGALVAAVSTATGDVVADPFVATHDVVQLLRLRAQQLDAAA